MRSALSSAGCPVIFRIPFPESAMSKASQRREAERRKRQGDVRGSPLKRLQTLLNQDASWEAPARFWRECVKHLPADPVTPTTDMLLTAIDKARPLIDIATANWTTEFYEADDDPDEIFPGVLMPFTEGGSPSFGSYPFSLFGRVTSDDTDMKQIVIDSTEPGLPAALWVFGTVATRRGETFVLAVHRDGTATAAVRVQGQWVEHVPSFVAPYVAIMTVELMIDENGTEATGIMGATSIEGVEWTELKRRAEILKQACSDAQMPYLRAMWRIAINQVAEAEFGGLKEEMKTAFATILQRDRESARQDRSESDVLRSQLQAARAKEQALQRELQQVHLESKSQPPEEAFCARLSPAQKLSGIF